MTITTASKNNAEAIKVIPKRHKLFVHMEDEKRVVLTRGRAMELFAELQQIGELDHERILQDFDRAMAVPDDEVIPYFEPPVYAVSIFAKEHSGENLQMLQAWLQDALFGWSDPIYRQVAFLKRTRKSAEEIFADLD